MLQPLVILGAGGFARETLDVVDAINADTPSWDVLGFLVDPQFGQAGTLIQEKLILGGFDWLTQYPDVRVVCAVGAPEHRRRLIGRIQVYGVKFATLIHPTVIRTRWIRIGDGVVIAAGSVLSNTIQIGDHVHINPSSTIGHDVTLGAFVSLAPGSLISGNVEVREGAYIGTGAKIIEKKIIGSWSIIGAGATVVKDVPPNTTVVGTPAHVIKERPEGWHLDENQN